MITKLTTILLGLLLIIGSLNSYAQVTIGIETKPAEGAMLELKNKDATNPSKVNVIENITSDKGGLALPRVWLTNKKTLEPFIPVADVDWTNASITKIKEKHAGLTVYNINNSSATETDLDKIFHQGIYVWDGAQWSQVGDSKVRERYFPMPAFNLPLTKITGTDDTKPTYDLYAEYKKQFTNDAGNPLFKSSVAMNGIPSPGYDRLYIASELDFVVTYYDDSVLKINSIDSNGVMTYEVKNTDPGPNSFINIIFVIK